MPMKPIAFLRKRGKSSFMEIQIIDIKQMSAAISVMSWKISNFAVRIDKRQKDRNVF